MSRAPFDQLERTHRRLEDHLEELAALADRAPFEAADVDVLRDVADYFVRAVPRHEEDEEKSLFPRLAGHAELASVVARIAAEHRSHEELHGRLFRVIDALGRDVTDARASDELATVVRDLVASYRRHVTEEEKVLFPAADAALSDADRNAISEEMAARRGRGGGGGGGGGGGRLRR